MKNTEHSYICSNCSPNWGLYKCNYSLVRFSLVFFFLFLAIRFHHHLKCEINLTSPKIIHTIEYLCLGGVHYGSCYGAAHLPSSHIHSVLLQKIIAHCNLICLFLKFVYVKSLVNKLVLKSCGLKCSTRELLVNSSCFWALAWPSNAHIIPNLSVAKNGWNWVPFNETRDQFRRFAGDSNPK